MLQLMEGKPDPTSQPRYLSFLNSTPYPPETNKTKPKKKNYSNSHVACDNQLGTPCLPRAEDWEANQVKAPTRPLNRLRREGLSSDCARRVLNTSLRRRFISRQGPGRIYKSRGWFSQRPSATRAPAQSPAAPIFLFRIYLANTLDAG